MSKKTVIHIPLTHNLKQRLEWHLDREHPYQSRRGDFREELRIDFALNAIAEKLDREEKPAFVSHPIGTELPGNITTHGENWTVHIPDTTDYPLSKSTELESKVTKAGYKTAEEVANAK